MTSLFGIADGLFGVRTASGDRQLGGIEFDNRIVLFCMLELNRLGVMLA